MKANLDNAAIAEQLEAFAMLLDLSGSSFYTSRAYRRAAEICEERERLDLQRFEQLLG